MRVLKCHGWLIVMMLSCGIEAWRTSKKREERRGSLPNFGDLLPTRSLRQKSARSPETNPEKAMFSDLIPAQQVDGEPGPPAEAPRELPDDDDFEEDFDYEEDEENEVDTGGSEYDYYESSPRSAVKKTSSGRKIKNLFFPAQDALFPQTNNFFRNFRSNPDRTKYRRTKREIEEELVSDAPETSVVNVRKKRSHMDFSPHVSPLRKGSLHEAMLAAMLHKPTPHSSPLHHPRPHPLQLPRKRKFKGYAPPRKGGGSLEEVFGIHTKYDIPPKPLVLIPAPHPTPLLKKTGYVPDFKHPTGNTYHSEYKGHPFSMEMIFGLPMHQYYMKRYGHMMGGHHSHHIHHPPHPKRPGPKYVPPKHKPHPTLHKPEPYYHEPDLHYKPEPHHKPEPHYEPEPHYKPEPHFKPEHRYDKPDHHYKPVRKYHEPHHDPYAPPKHGGSLEEIFHLPPHVPHKLEPKYHEPEPHYKPKPHQVHEPHHKPHLDYKEPHPYASEYGYKPKHHGYTLHYLPFEDYIPHHKETQLAFKRTVPTFPGAAHILVPSPHAHYGEKLLLEHQAKSPPPPLPPIPPSLGNLPSLPVARSKRSAEPNYLHAGQSPSSSFSDIFTRSIPKVSNNNDQVNVAQVNRLGRLPSINIPKNPLNGVFGSNRRPTKRPPLRKKPAPLKGAPKRLGTTTPVFPLCSSLKSSDRKNSPCQLPGGQLRGPGGIVVRPPPSHPIVQIHVGDSAKLPALAFFPVDSEINRRAVDAMAATAKAPPTTQATPVSKPDASSSSSAPVSPYASSGSPFVSFPDQSTQQAFQRLQNNQVQPQRPIQRPAVDALHVITSPTFTNNNQSPNQFVANANIQVGQPTKNPDSVNPFLQTTASSFTINDQNLDPANNGGFVPFQPPNWYLNNSANANVEVVGPRRPTGQHFTPNQREAMGQLLVGDAARSPSSSFFAALSNPQRPSRLQVQSTPDQNPLQQFLNAGINQNEFNQPVNPVPPEFFSRPTIPTIDTSQVTPAETDLQKLLNAIESSDGFTTPSGGVWNFKPTASTNLQELFRKGTPAIKAPEIPWEILRTVKVNFPQEVRLRMSEFQMLLDAAERSKISGPTPTDRWKIQKVMQDISNNQLPTQSPETVTVKTTDLQRLFDDILSPNEFSVPTAGVWNFKDSIKTTDGPKIDIESIKALKEHVSDMIEKHEDRIEEKGFMSSKEKDLMTELKDKAKNLNEIVDDLERQAKKVQSGTIFELPDNMFNENDFKQPTNPWNYRQAFREFMMKRIEAAKNASGIRFAKLPKARVTAELVAALKASDFEPPDGGVWDFKSASKLLDKMLIEEPRTSDSVDEKLPVVFPLPIPTPPEVVLKFPGEFEGPLSQTDEDEIRNIVLFHTQNAITPPDPSSSDLEATEPSDYVDEHDAEFPPERVTEKANKSHGVTYSHTNVVNKAGFPQVVIIPHYSSPHTEGKKIELSFNNDQVISFETTDRLLGRGQPADNLSNPFEKLQLSPNTTVATTSTSAATTEKRKKLNERRRQALLRASEKQELLLQNLLDAVDRHRQEVQQKLQADTRGDSENQVESIVEEAINKQVLALTGLKRSLKEFEQAANPAEDFRLPGATKEDFVGERLSLLEDASHRQLEVLESLIDAVQRLDGDGSQTDERLANLERIAEEQNLMLKDLSQTMIASGVSTTLSTIPTQKLIAGNGVPTLTSTSTTTTQVKIPTDMTVQERHDVFEGVESKDVKDNANKEDKKKQRRFLQQMQKLHLHLMKEQKKAHDKSLEAQREAVRDEMGRMAELLIKARDHSPITDDLSGERLKALKLMKRRKPDLVRTLRLKLPDLVSSAGHIVHPDSRPVDQKVVAWHQRFVDNFRLRNLQNRARRLRH